MPTLYLFVCVFLLLLLQFVQDFPMCSCTCQAATITVNTICVPTFGSVVLWQVMAIAGGLHSVEDLLQLLTGQTDHTVLQSCVHTGLRVLSTTLYHNFLRLSCFPVGSQGTTIRTVFMSL